MKRSIIIQMMLVAIALVQFTASAAGVSFSAQAPRQVVQGNRFSVVYVLRNGEGSSFNAQTLRARKKSTDRQFPHRIASNGSTA